jgi:predicted ATPase/DNA-binding CsgD family transcriptional regulator
MAYHEQLSDRERDILELLAAGAADKEIARQLHLSLNTVKWHNRQIYAKLGVENRTQAVAKAVELNLLGEEQPPAKPAFRIPHNLPAPVSSFVGREKEITEIIELLQDHRLVTLTGPGGVGKTRLALEVARSLKNDGRCSDGIYFVELAPVGNPDRVAKAVLDAIGLQLDAAQTVNDKLELFLEEKALLLVLDNFEHLLSGAVLVGELLTLTPKLRVLCTSREALQISGEQSYGVPPLEIHPSRELFLQRTRAIKASFEPNQADRLMIDRICAKLDCLPLAIELAAARMNFFILERLLDSLGERFRVLATGPRDAPERHQTLWDAIDWSYQLLSEEEQILFRRLSVFQGSRNIGAVEQICCQDLSLNALDGMSSLLVKNLIRQESGMDGEARFYLLETIHEYARERLAESGEEQEIHRRHARYFTELAERAKYPTRGGPQQIRWLHRLETEHDNLRAMYEWARDSSDVELGLCLVGSLDYFWLRSGFFDEADLWVRESLERLEGMPLEVKAGVYISAGMIYYYYHHDRVMSKKMYQEALALYTILENKREMGWVHVHLCDPSEMILEEREELLDHFEKAVVLLEEVGDQVGIAQALTVLGLHEEFTSNFEEARAAFEESLAIAQEIGDRLREAISLNNLSDIYLEDGDAEIAQELLKDAIKIEVAIGHTPIYAAGNITSLAGPALALGQPRRAMVLLGAADALYKRGAYRPQPPQERQFGEFQTSVREQLDQATCEKAWAAGQAMNPEEAIAFALEEPGQAG